MADARIIKERYAFVRPTGAHSSSSSSNNITTVNLPDGTDVRVNSSIFSDCTEHWLVNKKNPQSGLINQLFESLSLCDDSIKRDLANNIIIAGGTSLLPGLGDRLGDELNRLSFEEASAKGLSTPLPLRVMPSTAWSERGYTYQRKFEQDLRRSSRKSCTRCAQGAQ